MTIVIKIYFVTRCRHRGVISTRDLSYKQEKRKLLLPYHFFLSFFFFLSLFIFVLFIFYPCTYSLLFILSVYFFTSSLFPLFRTMSVNCLLKRRKNHRMITRNDYSTKKALLKPSRKVKKWSLMVILSQNSEVLNFEG